MYCVVVTDARNSSRSVGMRSSAPDGRRTFRSRAAWMFKSKRDHQREVSAFIVPPQGIRPRLLRTDAGALNAGTRDHMEPHNRSPSTVVRRSSSSRTLPFVVGVAVELIDIVERPAVIARGGFRGGGLGLRQSIQEVRMRGRESSYIGLGLLGYSSENDSCQPLP